jgi:hypothetical protein
MGRWAQCRRRGSRWQQQAWLPPPPIPVLAGEWYELVASSELVYNYGGTLALYWCATPGGALTQVETIPWDPEGLFSDYSWMAPGYLVCRATGNEMHFRGASGLSNYVAGP